MKKTPKRILGFFGLSVVAAMTIFAAALPGPGAFATSSVTDTIIVRVIGQAPNIDAEGIDSGTSFVKPKHRLTINYENVEFVNVKLRYTDKDGVEHTIELANEHVDYAAGTLPIDLNLDDPQFGYGDYVLIASGEGADGVTDEDIIEFTYNPFEAELDDDEGTGETYIDLDYNDGEGDPDGSNISKFIVEVFDKDGNLVEPLSPITVNLPDKQVRIPFGDYDLAPGIYTIIVTAYDQDNNKISSENFTKEIKNGDEPDVPDVPVPSTDVPDTGGFLKNLSVSKTDFVFTGIIVFFVIGVCGIIFINKRSKKNSRRR